MRFACMRTQKKRSGAVVQTKRSFSSLPSPHLPSWQNPGLQGRKGAFRLHENAENEKWCCGADETLLFVPPEPPFGPSGLERGAGGPGAANWGRTSPLPLSPSNAHLDRAGSSGAPVGRGLLTWHGPAPSPSVSLRLCLTSISTHLLSHAGPGGRRTSPACGSCRRPLKSCDNKGIEKRMERKKISRGENQS